MHGGRRQGACGRDVHRRPPDGRMATAGRQPRRGSYTISLRQAPAALLARGTWKIPDHHRRVRRLLSYTDDLSGFVERALSLLETGGSFSTRWCKACIWKMAMANPNPGIRPSWSTQPAAT